MAAHPELQKQAQEEIDQVFGQDEMPHTVDAKKLPFLRACLLEVCEPTDAALHDGV
jgi:hypothetical protein